MPHRQDDLRQLVEDLRSALAASETRYQALVKRAGYGYLRTDADGRIGEANDALAQMLGYTTASRLIGRNVGSDVYVDPRDFEVVRAIAGDADFSRFIDSRWKRDDGGPVRTRVALRVITGEGGSVSYEGIADDLTDRLRHEEILRRTERMASLGTTLAGVAHELNNPLAAITGFAYILLHRAQSAEDRSALETINHEAMRAATIVRDLLAVARSREAERRVVTTLNDIVGYVANSRRYALETRGISLDLHLDTALPRVRGDRTQLEQVILNLVTNAEHALRPAADAPSGDRANEHPRIVVRTRREENAGGASAVIEVEDNGPGLPDGEATRIWDPFWTTKEEGEGTGLGLTLVHSIVTEHRGEVAAESVPEGGARFTIRLPAATAGESDAERAARPLDILVTVSNEDDLSFIVRFLTSRGHAVLSASDAERALNLAAELHLDAVICDADELRTEREALAARGRRVVEVRRPYDVEEMRRAVEDG